jgi:Sel1 repeat
MAAAGTNRAWLVAWLVVTAALCGGVAVGMARSPDLQFELGYAYENGNFHGWHPGFAQNHRKAAHWLGRAAQTNHPRAQYMLGILHAHGWGVPRDRGLAVDWFTRSARNGYAPACYHLGWMYHKGDGVARDDDRARRLLEQAAVQGMAAAHLALGRIHERGEGVPPDAVQALKWYVLAVHFARSQPGLFDNAAFAGRTHAAADALASRMDPSHEEQSRTLARRWLATNRPLQRTAAVTE